MSLVQPCPLPTASLLERYVGEGNFTDSYVTTVPRTVSLEQYVAAFYTTPLFKLERWVLGWSVNRPSTDDEAVALARGVSRSFAAWQVEARTDDQLLMCDLFGNTRSWLMSVPEGQSGARLFFGSAVVAKRNASTHRHELGSTFKALLGFHKLYSRALLRAARARVLATRESN